MKCHEMDKKKVGPVVQGDFRQVQGQEGAKRSMAAMKGKPVHKPTLQKATGLLAQGDHRVGAGAKVIINSEGNGMKAILVAAIVAGGLAGGWAWRKRRTP